MKPRQAVSIAAWIKLDSNKGYHSIFDTVGGHSMHQQGQYHFEIQDGSVRWFHRNETGIKIFSVETGMSAIDNSNESSRSALCYFFFCGIICSFGGEKLLRKYDEVRLVYCCEVYICFKNLSLTSPWSTLYGQKFTSLSGAVSFPRFCGMEHDGYFYSLTIVRKSSSSNVVWMGRVVRTLTDAQGKK